MEEKLVTVASAVDAIRLTESWNDMMATASRVMSSINFDVRLSDEQLAAIRLPFERVQRESADAIREFSASLARSAEVAERTMGVLAPRIHNALVLLGRRGWFPDPKSSVDFVMELGGKLGSGRFDDVDDAMVTSVEERRADQLRGLCERHPKRAQIFEDAFLAHDEGKYLLSVPPLLAQADGIWFDQFRFGLSGKKRVEKLAPKARTLDPFGAALFGPFLETLPMFERIERWEPVAGHLNRHAVLHGLEVNYGTRVSSCKAMSLLGYVSYLALR